jgi:hypothetical protein
MRTSNSVTPNILAGRIPADQEEPTWGLKFALALAESNLDEGEGGVTSNEGLRQWEGRQVSVALADGSRIDDCQLVSAGRNAAATLWLFTNGSDRFIPIGDVTSVWDAGGCFQAA